MRMTQATRNRSHQSSLSHKSQKKDPKRKQESITLPRKINLQRSKTHVVVEIEEAVPNKGDTTMTVRFNRLLLNVREKN